MKAREYDLRLQEQVKLTRQEVLTMSEAATLQHQALDNCIKRELSSVRSLSIEVRDNVGGLGDSMETSFSLLHEAVRNTKASTNAVHERIEKAHVYVKSMNEELRRATTNVNDNISRGTRTIKAAFKRNLKLQTQNARSQKNTGLQAHQDMMRIKSMLAHFVVSNARSDHLDVDYFRIDGVEAANVMMPLMLMSTYMPSMFSKLAEQQSLGIAREDIETIHKEFNLLLAASHEASASALKGDLLPTTCTSSRSTMKRRIPEEDVLSRNSGKKRRLEKFRYNSSAKTQRQLWSQCLATGELSIVVEAQQKEGNKSSSVVISAFFVPRPEICSTGLLAMFKRIVTRASTPKLSRYMRSFNVMLGNIEPAQVACMSNDVETLQAMLAAREITPWDRNEHGWTLLLVRICYSDYFEIRLMTTISTVHGAVRSKRHDFFYRRVLDTIIIGGQL